MDHIDDTFINKCHEKKFSQLIQKDFKNNGYSTLSQFIKQLQPKHIQSLLSSMYGNYILQCILENFVEDGKQLLSFITNSILPYEEDLSNNQFGCRIFQRIVHGNVIRLVLPSLFPTITDYVLFLHEKYLPNLFTKYCTIDHAHHITEQFVKLCVSQDYFNRFLYPYWIKPYELDIINGFTNVYYSRILLRLFELSDEGLKLHNIWKFLNNIVFINIDRFYKISINPYGNYILQQIFKKFPQIRFGISEMILSLNKLFIPLCLNKYGSNLVECIISSGHCNLNKFAIKLISIPNDQMSKETCTFHISELPIHHNIQVCKNGIYVGKKKNTDENVLCSLEPTIVLLNSSYGNFILKTLYEEYMKSQDKLDICSILFMAIELKKSFVEKNCEYSKHFIMKLNESSGFGKS